MKKIKPQCMPHNFDFTKAKDLGNFPNFTSAGYMLPCCWLDHTPLKKENFAKLMKAATTLNLIDVAVIGNGSKIHMVATDKKNKSSNEYSIDVGETDKTFKAYFKVENFKMISDDYDVSISSQKISHFVNRNKKIQYWIALEPDSEF